MITNSSRRASGGNANLRLVHQKNVGPPPSEPHNSLAEMRVLAHILADNSIYSEIVERLSPGDFVAPLHATLFQAISAVFAEGGVVDAVTLEPKMRELSIGEAPAQGYVASLQAEANHDRGKTLAYIDDIRKHTAKRDVLEALKRAERVVRDGSATTAVIDAALSRVAMAGGCLPTNTATGQVIARRFDTDIQSVPIQWLWQQRFALGKLNVIAGDPGLGKSQITAALVATVTCGGAWPDGTSAPLGSAVLIAGEDDAADTIKPRLEAAGADLSKVRILDWINDADFDRERAKEIKIKRSFDIGEDAARLEALCREIGDVRLIVIDPVSAYMGRADSHKNADVRAALAPLTAMAADIGACIVLVAHLNKNAEGGAITRISGSGAYVAAARSAWLVGPHPTLEGARALVPLKNNIGDDKTGFVYRIEGAALPCGISTSRVVFDAASVTIAPDELLKARTHSDASDDDGDTALGEAVEFLRLELANGQRAKAKALKSKAGDAGISWRTVERAKKSLGIKSQKFGDEWSWSLPPQDRQGRQDRHLRRDGELGGLEDEDRQHGGHGNLGGVGGLGGVEDHGGCACR